MGVARDAAKLIANARTRYYLARYRKEATWGAGVRVCGRIRLSGPGRIMVGAGCVFERGAVNVIKATTPGSTVSIGDGCRLAGVDIDTTGEVTIAAEVQLRRVRLDGAGRIVVGKHCEFDQGSGGNAVHAVHPSVTVAIGEGCYLNGVDVFATENTTIGERCIVGQCSLVTTDFHSTRADRWSPEAPVNRGPITIGDNVWIAARTVITKNVTIGENSVVSIGTIVREDVPADVIVSSHEQRIVKQLRSG
jgi:acetyltransferase-like isoleucine patch superfamily enzyme